MLILGLTSFKHDTAAALFEDGVIKAAIENDKIARSHTSGLPEAAIRVCLEKAGATLNDLDMVAVATKPFRGWTRRSLLRAKLSPFSPISAAYHEANELGVIARDLQNLRSLHKKHHPLGSKIRNFDHHLCHAANAFFLSPFERALVLTLDQEGDGVSGMVATGENRSLRTVRTIPFPNSLAWIYAQVTALLGFVPHHDEHKTQWLSLKGEPVHKDVFLAMLRNPKNHLPRLNFAYVNRGLAGRLTFSNKFYKEIGIEERGENLTEEQRSNLASSLQAACTDVVASLIEDLRQKTGVRNVCLGGGLFQKTLLVAELEKRLGRDEIYVPPAPGNSGNAIGAGLLAWHQALQKPRGAAVHEIYGGPSCSRTDIKDVLDNCKARYSLQITEDRRLETAIHLLESGKIVGWCQGAAEFGPRALGNRSLLASPWAEYVRENLNDYIKHREWFRPFAVSVPEEDCDRYFDASMQCRAMNSLAWAKPEANVLPEGFLLPGNLVRLHVVSKQANPQFWRLLKRFGEKAPAPLLVNTSFNMFGEPLVIKPRDAVRSYFCSGIDALVIDNFVLSKTATSFVLAANRAS